VKVYKELLICKNRFRIKLFSYNTLSMHGSSSLDDEWSAYCLEQSSMAPTDRPKVLSPIVREPMKLTEPIIDNLLSISTNTKLVYLNQPIDNNIYFWKIPIIEYYKPQEGVIYKDMKIQLRSPAEIDQYFELLETNKVSDTCPWQEHIIKQINIQTPTKHQFLDERKISVGMSKKDIYNKKITGAFIHCFCIIIRFELPVGTFREVHVKIFNTGNVEIPGIQSPEMFSTVKQKIIETLQPLLPPDALPLDYLEGVEQPHEVLVNSNFRCGFYIDRESIYTILRDKYHIDASYDSSSYPAVKCKFYYNLELDPANRQRGTLAESDRSLTLAQIKKSTKYVTVTFSIFRTGSCIISGNCSDEILYYVYEFVKNLLLDEYAHICFQTKKPKAKERKLKKKYYTVTIDIDNYNSLCLER
jgi:hypothetical protein